MMLNDFKDKDKDKDVEESFVVITKLSVPMILKLGRWFARQNTSVKIDIFNEQRNQFFKYKKLVEHQEIVPLIAFYMAVKHYYDLDFKHNAKNKSMNIKEFEKSSDFSVKQYKSVRLKVKREKLLNLWSVIKSLKSEGFSMRKISNFLQSKHRLKVSHTYISQLWKELENE